MVRFSMEPAAPRRKVVSCTFIVLRSALLAPPFCQLTAPLSSAHIAVPSYSRRHWGLPHPFAPPVRLPSPVATGEGLGEGATLETMPLAFDLFVNGTLMRGLALAPNLDGATFLGEFDTAPIYRVYSIDDRHPGMFEVGEEGGVAVAGELYSLPEDVWQRVEAGEPPHLYKGPVTLTDGRVVNGILYPRELAEGRHRDISEYGGWRAYWAAREVE